MMVCFVSQSSRECFRECFLTQSCSFIFSELMSALNTFERAKWKGCKTPFVAWLWNLFLNWTTDPPNIHINLSKKNVMSLQEERMTLHLRVPVKASPNLAMFVCILLSGSPKVVCMICIFPPINLDSCWHFYK